MCIDSYYGRFYNSSEVAGQEARFWVALVSSTTCSMFEAVAMTMMVGLL